jgi:glycosyltransferase involved in cell wall biosynthesis
MQPGQPHVSVIIPNYNGARFLRQAIDSVLDQTYHNVEVIVVDDGSRDDSAAILRSYGERIRWFEQPNQGVSVARNRGIDECRGELVAFLDVDDVWEPSKLEKQVPLFANPAVGLVYCGYFVVDDELRPLQTCIPVNRGWLLEKFAQSAAAVIVGGGSIAVIRRSCFDQVGKFDPALSTSADWDMYRRVCSRYQVDLVPEPLMRYRQHASNMHRRVAIYEHDVLLRLEKMFADPLCTTILPLRAQAYGKSYLALSGSYLHQGNWPKCLGYAWRAVITWPPSVGYLLASPVRAVRRQNSALGRRPVGRSSGAATGAG